MSQQRQQQLLRVELTVSQIDSYIVKVMYVLVCRESGLDCNFVIKGETKDEFLKDEQKHGMRAEDINLNDIPVNLLCHSFNEGNKEV
jgi:predicted small metal-binding protein